MTEIEIHSKTWRAVKALCDSEIEDARTRMEEVGLAQPKTDALRGAIGALRSVLALDKSDQPVILQGPGDTIQR